jgi:stress response protein YsnF
MMVEPQSDSQADSPVFLLSSKYIQKVDASNQAVFVDISLSELKQLPLYQTSNNTSFSGKSPAPLLNQERRSSFGETPTLDETPSIKAQSSTTQNLNEVPKEGFRESNASPEVLEEQTIRLLEERVLVSRSKRKLGEVVVRKQIETRFVEVPVQSQKLIIDSADSESKQPVEVERLPVEQVSTDKVAKISEPFPTPMAQSLTTKKLEHVENQSVTESDDTIHVVEEEIVRLLEERLVVNRSKWKVGEVIVRKEIETEIVQVPLRREKLIINIEQVGVETKQLAEIDLAKGEVTRSDTIHQSVSSSDTSSTVMGEFLSPKAASNLLEAIALQKHHGCAKVRVELVVDNPELQETYQKMFDRCSTR